MLFSSNLFLWAFLPLTVVSAVFLKPRYSNILLFAASLLFYAWGEPFYVLLMIFSICANWLFGLLIDRADRFKKLLLAADIAMNLSLLGYFKYYTFFADTVNGIFGSEIFAARDIALPIGISFFTFQTMSYIIDLYRGNCSVQKNVLRLGLYVSFFPQLIAGPIVRYTDVAQQIDHRTLSAEKFASGFRRFLYGLGKKVIISNTMAQLADIVFATEFAQLTFASAWLGAVCYTLQIYYDFSGYSDMAIGLGRIFGFEFLENFRYPYLSKTIQEFWQRWHISLGTWFREYVYIPLGGNRRGSVRTYINLVTVFFLTGMWHGASWTFVVWGLYHGFFQIAERLGLKKFLSEHSVLSHIYCTLVVIFGWVIFRSNTLYDSVRYILRMVCPWRYGLENMFSLCTELGSRDILILICAAAGCGLVQLVSAGKPALAERWKFSFAELFFLAAVCLYCIILLAAGSYNPFIYFRF
ncbi:MAG: MBOAT family protein [Oscillospiraceae bacterium]|nr:MBOAT family protein [Oscillospiraceae bacterium]